MAATIGSYSITSVCPWECAAATLAFLTFNGAWNNYILPFYMLNHQELYNLPLGIGALINAQAGHRLLCARHPSMNPNKRWLV